MNSSSFARNACKGAVSAPLGDMPARSPKSTSHSLRAPRPRNFSAVLYAESIMRSTLRSGNAFSGEAETPRETEATRPPVARPHSGPTIFIAVPKPRHSASLLLSLPSPHPHPSPLPLSSSCRLTICLRSASERRAVLFQFSSRAPPPSSLLSLFASLNVKIRCVCAEETDGGERGTRTSDLA